MIEEELLGTEEEKKPGLLSNPIVQISIIVISLAVAVSVSSIISFVVAKRYKPYTLVVSPLKEIKYIPPQEPLNSSNMGDFLVRLKDPDIPRYLKIKDLSIAYDGKRYKHLAAEIEKRTPQIKSLINDILINQSSDVNTVEGKEALKKELITKINKIIIPKKGKIIDVYMELLIQ